MKRLISVILLCTVCLFSCTNTENAPENYKNDVDVSVLSSKVLETAPDISFTKAGNAYIELNLPIDTSLCEEYEVYLSSTGTADLFGVFKTSNVKDAETVAAQGQEYLDTLEENWMSEYLPEELPKVENAVCKQFGQYVTFVILEDSLRDNAISNIEAILKK